MNYTRHFECGCKVVVIGELTNAEIRYCPKHEAAPDMYEALEGLATCFRNIEILSNTTDEFEKGMLEIAIDTMAKALAKAEGK